MRRRPTERKTSSDSSPRPPHVFVMERVETGFHLQIEAIKQVRYFNRASVLKVLTSALFYVMAVSVGTDAVCARDPG